MELIFWTDLTVIDPTAIVAETRKAIKFVPFSIALTADRMAISRKIDRASYCNVKDLGSARTLMPLKQIATACSSQKPLSN